DRGFLFPAILDPFQIAIEEFALEGDGIGREEGREIRPGLHLEPFRLRGDADEALDRAAQMQAEPAPIRDDERRHIDLREIGRARLIPSIERWMRAHIVNIVEAIGLELLRRQARGSGRALAPDEIRERRVCFAVLVVEYAVLPPAADEAVDKD